MGEIDELDDPVDHRVAEGDQRVDRTQGQEVLELLDAEGAGTATTRATADDDRKSRDDASVDCSSASAPLTDRPVEKEAGELRVSPASRYDEIYLFGSVKACCFT